MLKTAPIFTDNMVLQREKPIAVWGMAEGQKEVRVSLKKNSVNAQACDADGKMNGSTAEYVTVMSKEDGSWSAALPSMCAGGPYRLCVCSGKEEMCFENVMIGEVWLAGGQSNMELELQNSLNGKEAAAAADNPLIRYFNVPHVGFEGEEMDKADAQNSWHVCTQKTAGACSAVGYYFAKQIADELGVCIGIIGCNWGGTSASCWMDEETIMQRADTKIYMDEYNQAVAGKSLEEYLKEKEEYEAYYEEWNKRVEEYYATHEDPSWEEVCNYAGENRWPGPVGPRSEYRPTGLYHAMLKRICPYTLRGFLYYQGEEDDKKPRIYYSLLQSLVQKWRSDWKDDRLPFLCVQLPMFKNKGEKDYKTWPLIREAQMRLFETVKNTGIAVILDCGEFNNIHPLNKETVGNRLALQALSQVYGRDADAFGPIYRSYEVCGNQVKISFDYAGDGIVYKKDTSPGLEPEQGETGFEIAGEDKAFHPAQIQVEENVVTVSSDAVPDPHYVRYAWTNYGPVTMFGKNGIPMAPFRTSREDEAECP